MTPSAEILEGDALERLAELEAGSFDAMITDPPYGISFMGRRWDYDVPSVGLWREALRVLRPGAPALVACGTRTQHRMVVNLEDAGFEVRDVIAWIYGSGFPKSHDVSKAIDRAAGADREITSYHGHSPSPGAAFAPGEYAGLNSLARTAPATPDAARWVGYGTALKPAMELWTLVRRPLEGTVAQNALEHGVGGLNVDGTRIPIETEDPHRRPNAATHQKTAGVRIGQAGMSTAAEVATQDEGYHNSLGRWPANVTHDGSPEVLEHFPDTAPSTGGGGRVEHGESTPNGIYRAWGARDQPHDVGHGDFGSAARFFYCAKADTSERDAGVAGGNAHPTVKPLSLAAWLATLLLPPARQGPRRLIVPFSGSGSEMIGARLAGWEQVVGIELDPAYAEIARARLDHHVGGRLW